MITLLRRFILHSLFPLRETLTKSKRMLLSAIQLTWRCSPLLTFGILLFLILQTFLPLLNLFFFRLVLNRAISDAGNHTISDPLALRFPLIIWIACMVITVVIGQLFQLTAQTLQTMMADRLTVYVTEHIIHAANHWQGLSRFEDPAFADDLNRARNNAHRLGLDIMINGASILMSAFTIISILLLLISLHVLLPLILLISSLPSIVYWWKYISSNARILYNQTPDARRLEYYRNIMITIDAAKDVRLYGLGLFFSRSYNTLFASIMTHLNATRDPLTRTLALVNILSSTIMGLAFTYIVWLTIQGRLSLGSLILFGGAITLLQSQIRRLGVLGAQLPESLHFLPGVFRLLEALPDLPVAAFPYFAPRPIQHGIIFDHVSFTYPGQSKPILQDISFNLKPGECVALVGHNGAGKTTIVKLLLRLYDPTAGRILLDGIDLRDYDLNDLRRVFGAVFQDFVRYDLSVAENIGLGQINALQNTSKLWEAVHKVDATSFVAELPQGLDTMLGRTFGGLDLSGGQWQKLALARAFVRDSQVLVLDEPTAALDMQTEYEIYTHFRELTRDRITLLISHRFSTVRMADRILFLQDGRIQEEGSHAELMILNANYARFYNIQAAHYLEKSKKGR